MPFAPGMDLSDPLVRQALLAERKAARAGKKYTRPPVVEEIAKAYKADPRSQLALQAMATGASTKPVAEGKYGIADGIARALTGVAGGYIDKQQQQKYGADEDTYTDTNDILASQKEQRAAEAAKAALQVPTPPPVAPPVAAPPPPGTPPPVPPPQGAPPAPPGAAIAPQIAAAVGNPAPSPLQPPALPAGGVPGATGPFPVSSSRGAANVGTRLAAVRASLVSQGLRVNSGYRTPEHNRAVGGVPTSYHQAGTPDEPFAYDFGPKKGESMAQAEARVRATAPGFKVINEGDHIHVQPPSGTPRTAAATMAAAAPTAGPINPFAPPTPEAVPELPPIVGKPDAPKPVAARRSELLQAAYDVMHTENPYMVGKAEEYERAGLAEQDRMNEAAAEREQRVSDMGYQTELGRYAASQGNREQYGYDLAKAAVAGGRAEKNDYIKWQRDRADKAQEQGFTHSENEATRANALAVAQSKAKGLKVPQKITTSYAGNTSSINLIDKAIAAIKKNPRALGLQNMRGDALNQRYDPGGVSVRAIVANIGSLKRHDRSGASVTVGEQPYLKPFIPASTDRWDAAIKKLEGLREEMQNANAEMETEFGPNTGYEGLSVPSDAPLTPAEEAELAALRAGRK